MNVLLIGPILANNKHGAEVGIYNAFKKLGHNVFCYDQRVKKIVWKNGDSEMLDYTKHDKCPVESVDLTLICGPGFNQAMLDGGLHKFMTGKKVLWNSESVRLKCYYDRLKGNTGLFDYVFTFDEAEILIYHELGFKNTYALLQAYNPDWYKPLPGLNTRYDVAFVGSFGGKWSNRQVLLDFIKDEFNVVRGTLLDAEAVNEIYNESKVVLNLGLQHGENPFVSFGRQQRLFECFGSGRIYVTNEIPGCYKDKEFIHNENILYYNKDNVIDILKHAIKQETRERMEPQIKACRWRHVYEERIKRLLEIVK